ncbi:MAG: hypothetical protein WD572_04145 [Gammaproteobacteria bacterium]
MLLPISLYMAPVTVIHYLQEQEGIHLKVKARKVARGAVWQRSIVKFFEHFEGFSEQGIFHDIATYTNY